MKINVNSFKEYFHDRLLRKTVAFVMLLFFNFNIFSEVILDPVSIGTKVTKSTSGIDQIDIAAPNKNGTSYNSLKELQVSEQGLILNNNKHVVVNTHIAGLVARNRNLDGGMAANLIITEVTGKNRTNINGIVEVAGQRADLVMANRNGIYINGGGFLNTDRVTLTTGKLEMNEGNLVSINVSEGHIGIGERGVDALSLSDLELLSKTIDIAGVIKASKETKVLISTGGQTYEYRTKEVKSKGETYKGIAVDGKAAGSMYAGKIDIISNDKGAGVNTKGDLVSVDDITLTASGDITTNKVNAGKGVAYKSTRKVKIKGTTSAGQKVQIKSKETEISAKVVTGYLEKALGKEALEIESEKTKVNSEVEAQGKVSIKSKLTENGGNIFATEKVEVSGEKFDNSNGELRSNQKIEIDTQKTVNNKGYILSDGLTKEDVKKEEETKENSNSTSINTEKGINITGTLDNREGVIKGREITIGGNITSNSKGKIDSIGALTLNGKVIDNKNGVIKGSIKKIKADKLINDEGQLLSNEKIEGVIKQTSNIRGEIFGNEGVKLVGEKLNNLTGVIRSNGKIDTDIKHTGNIQGFILSDGITKEEAEKWQVQEKVSEKKDNKKDEKKEEVKEQTTGVILKGERLENTKGIIASLGQTTINIGGVSNKEGKIVSRGVVELITPNEYVYEGLVEGDYVTTLKGKKITVNEKINRNSTLELIAENGINLKEDIVSRILNIDIKSDLKNTKEIKGTDTLSVTAKNIENEGNLLSDKKLYVTAENKVINKGTGLIKGHESTRIEGNIIENNRGKILSEGSLTLIAETLIRNELGKIHSKGDLYGEVRKGNFENVGMSEVEIIDEVKEIPVVGSAETNRKGFYGFGLRRRNNTPKTVQITERKVNVHTEDSDITGEGNIVIKAEKGALVNKDGGRIEGKGVYIKAGNVYNIGKYIQDEKDSNHIVLATGGRIKGSDVYMEVSGKVVNGTEEYTKGTQRREDGVLVDNRKVGVVLNPSVIAGSQNTTIKAGEFVNTSQIGVPERGTVLINVSGKVLNASIGNNIGKIEGKEVLVEGNKGITNIGGEIKGNEITKVTSEKGKVLNESTISSDTLTRERSVNLPFRERKTYTEVYGITENIRNIGKIEGNGIVYVKGKEVENIAGDIRGKSGTLIKSTEKDIVDKTITLRDERKDVSETVTVTKQVRDTKTIRRGGRDGYEKEVPYGPARTVQVQETRHWDTLNKTKTVSGTIGDGKDTVLDSARDLILESSNLRAKDDIVLNAKKYILMLSSVDTEYKYKTQTTKKGGGLRRKKVTTSTWIEDNVYANPVEITNEGNVLINYKGIGKPAENRGVFAQGVNFNTKGQIIGVSDGNIYIQGTKDKLNSIYDSQTTKSWIGIKYRRKSDYISDNKEKYKHSQLYGEAGIKIDSEGKLKIEGVDVQTSGPVFLRGKLGVEILAGDEISSRYEEHKDKGLKLSANRDGVFAGVEKNKNETAVHTIRSVGSIINSKGGSVKIEGDSIVSIGSKIGAAGDIILDGTHGVVLKDGENFASIREQNEKIRAGVFANANGKNLSASAGVEAAYTKENAGKTVITPERNVLVTNKDIYIKTGEGSILLQGDIGAKGNISVEATKGKIYVKDSQSEIMTDNESVKARIALAFNLNLGGIKDTFKSFKDGYKALKEVPNIGRVGSFIKDIVKGRSLLESLEGREKTINAMSTLFNGPSSGGVSAGIGLNVNISSAKNTSEYLQHITTNIRAGQDILLKSKELETEGGFVRAENDLTIEAEKVKLLASADTYKMKGKNAGANFGVVIYGAEGYSAGMNYGEMKSEGTLYNNSHIQAGNKVSIKAEDMEIRGGRVEGRHTAVDVKSLVIESIQDKEELKQIGVSAGYSKQYGTHTDTQGNTTPDNKNNVNAGLSYGKRDKLWVKEQSGIVGRESVDVNVKGKLTLIGSIIANINEKGEDGGNLKLSYGEIETRDLDDYDKLLNLDGNMSLNQRSKGNNTELALDKKGNVKEVANRVDEEYGVGVEGHDRRRITRTTIGRGTVLGSVSESINRDIKKSQEITKGVEVKRTEFRFKSEPNSWGDFNNIMSNNAGMIGNFLDDVNEGMLGKERTNHEGEFRNTVHKIISKIESPIDKANRFISLFPTSETHGGMLEQIVRTIRQDKTPIIKITVQRKEDGTSSVNMEELKKISDYKPKDGGTVKVNTNGIIELKGQAARNTIFKNITKEDMAKYNRGEAIEYIMIYNPTRGAVSDLIESALGKMFDGSWSSLGLSIGVNRGAAVAYASIDKKQNYDFSFYSQGNIVGLGAFNILKNKGIRLGDGQESFKVRMYGTPIVKAGFERFENPLGIKVVGAAINEPDFIGSNGKWKGLVGERRPVLGVKTEDIERMKKNWKDSKVVANMPIIKSILREEPGGVLALPKLVSEEEKAKYKENPSKWLKENNYSMPITREQLNQIRGNYQEEVKDNLIAEGKGKLSDNWIMKKWLNDGHGAYTYYSAIYAGEIDKLLKDYVKANGVERLGIESEIERKYIENQEKLIELFTNGPAILNDSQGLREGVTEYNRRDFEKEYNQGRYIDKGLPSNYITNSMNEGIRKGKLGALDISEYIESLRNGVGLR